MLTFYKSHNSHQGAQLIKYFYVFDFIYVPRQKVFIKLKFNLILETDNNI